MTGGDPSPLGKAAIFTGHNHLITIRRGNADALGKSREQLDGAPSLLGQGVDYVLHAILHRIFDQCLPIFGMIEDDVLAMAKPSLDNFLGQREVDRTFSLRSERIRFQRTVGGFYGMNFKNMPELDTPYILRRARAARTFVRCAVLALQDGQVSSSTRRASRR